MPEILPVRSRSDREGFLRLPWRIYRDLPQWVPPILSMQRREIDPRRGPFFNDGFGSKAEYFLAREKGEIVGRIAAIRNERHLSRHGDGVGFFGFFECTDDPETASSLLGAAEHWLHREGLSIARGPTSFTLNDPSGVTVEGEGERSSALIAYTPPYYAGLLAAAGYHKIRDLLTYRAPLDLLDRNLRLDEPTRVELERSGITIRSLRRKDLECEAAIVARVFSESWDRNWGSFPMIPGDFIHAAKDMGPFFDERLGAVALFHGEPIGVLLAAADPSEILHHLDGRIGLRGLFRILRDRHKIERLRIFILGLLPEHRKLPIGPLLLDQLRQRRARFPCLKTIEFSWILEDNLPTRRLVESMGATVCQRLRLFEKYLS